MASNRMIARVLALSAGLACSLTALAQQVQPGVVDLPGLELRTGWVDTSVRAGTLAQHVAQARQGEVAHHVIQLDGPMTPERRNALQRAGVTVMDYLPTNAFLVRLDRADAAAAGRLPFVRWSGAFQNEWKLEPETGKRSYETPERQALALAGRERMLVYTFAGLDPAATERALGDLPGAKLLWSEPAGERWEIMVEMPLSGVEALKGLRDVQWAEPEPESVLRSNYNTRWIISSNLSPASNALSVAFPIHSLGIRGEGQVIGIIDSGVAQSHCSFQDTVNPIGPSHRKIVAYNGAASYGQHGTHVAGTALGDPVAGTPDPVDTRGIAFNAKLAYGGGNGTAASETGFINQATFQANAGARIHTNSWGNDGTTAYTSNCRGIDRFVYENEDNLVLFAVSNGSVVTTPENAKNCLGVGATGPSGSQQNFGSGGTGPTAQGSRRPEVWAPGQATISASGSTGCSTASLTGTSMASPAMAGAAALIRQYLVQGWYPSGSPTAANSIIPTGALLRAMLINAGQDMTGGAGYPGARENWGRIELDQVLQLPGSNFQRQLLIKDVRNAQGLSTGGVDDTPIQVTASTQQLRVTMAFHEPAAATNAANIFVNNLNLEVVDPSGNVYVGNNFNTTTGQTQIGGAADANDNAENVYVSNPTPGTWIVRVRGFAVNQGTQGFAWVATGNISAGAPACYANCDGSSTAPVLNALDFSCFLDRYVAGNSYANCDGSTAAPVLNALDFSCFLNRYVAGCP